MGADECRVAVERECRAEQCTRAAPVAVSFCWCVHVVPLRTNTYAEPYSVSSVGP